MDTSAPWMEALVQGDLPIVELTNSDLIGLDKDDDNLGAQDFGVIEPLAEIASPGQQLENVDNLSENSFCMMEPEIQMDDSDPKEPEDCADDEMKGDDNTPEICTSDQGDDNEEDEEIMESTDAGVRTPTPEFLEPIVQINTPDVEILPQIIPDPPEIVTIDDTPEKVVEKETGDSPCELPVRKIFDSSPEFNLKDMQIKLVKIDDTLNIVNNSVILPKKMCDSDINSNGLQSSRTRRTRTASNKRSPYSLRLKTEPPDDYPTDANPIRFNPYALSGRKSTDNKRPVVKSKVVKKPLPQPDTTDDFLPTDFLEASMSEGGLLEKTLTLPSKKQPTKVVQNGTGNKAKAAPQRLSSFRSGIVTQVGGGFDGLDTLAKVMANSSVSLTHCPKGMSVAGKTGKTPGQTGMVNHDHLYSSRLSNENVTRLETEVRSLKQEVETLREKLTAANAYIKSMLNTTAKAPAPKPIQTRAQLQPFRAPPNRAQTQSFRSPAQTYRGQAQPYRGQTQPYRGQTQAYRGQTQQMSGPRGQNIRGTSMRGQSPRSIGPRVQAILPHAPQPRKSNPGVMVMPMRPSVQPPALHSLQTSTRALTVIPIRKGPRVSDPEVVMPSFEQVNVNEHFGMHFLTE